MKPLRKILQGAERVGHRFRPMPVRKHIPIRQPSTSSPGTHQPIQEPGVVFRRHILEYVAQVVSINGIITDLVKEILDGPAVRMEAPLCAGL